MAECELIQSCMFFNDRMAHMPVMTNVYKEKYCKCGNENCARFVVFKNLGRDAVPKNLFPNQFDTANEIIRKHKEGMA